MSNAERQKARWSRLRQIEKAAHDAERILRAAVLSALHRLDDDPSPENLAWRPFVDEVRKAGGLLAIERVNAQVEEARLIQEEACSAQKSA
jgi:hypothetical protein